MMTKKVKKKERSMHPNKKNNLVKLYIIYYRELRGRERAKTVSQAIAGDVPSALIDCPTTLTLPPPLSENCTFWGRRGRRRIYYFLKKGEKMCVCTRENGRTEQWNKIQSHMHATV